jgi:hypothetical protein
MQSAARHDSLVTIAVERALDSKKALIATPRYDAYPAHSSNLRQEAL